VSLFTKGRGMIENSVGACLGWSGWLCEIPCPNGSCRTSGLADAAIPMYDSSLYGSFVYVASQSFHIF